MQQRASLPRLAVVVAALATHAVLPPGTLRDVLYAVVGAVCAAQTCRAAGRITGPQRRAWQLLALGLVAWVIGDVVWTLLERGLGVQPFPSVADVAYVASYPLLAAGLVRAFPAPRGRRPTWLLDALLVTSGALLVLWLLVLEPTLAGWPADPLGTAVGALYPLGDAVLLVLLARAATAAGTRPPALRLSTWGVLAILLADELFLLAPGWPALDARVHLIDTLWLTGYVLLASAARHASAGRAAPPRADGDLGTGYLVLLGASVCVLPGTAALEAARGLPVHLAEVCIAAMVVIAAFLLRFGGLLRAMRRQHARLEHLAVTDHVTGLANATGLARRVEAGPCDAPPGTVPAVLLVALDGYRDVAQTLGHAAADDLLRAVAAVVGREAGDDGTPARLARDVFAVGLDVDGPDAAESAARRLVERLTPPLPVGGLDLSVRPLVGVAVAAGRPAAADVLVARADGALAAARRRDDRVGVDAGAPAVPTPRGPGAATAPREADLLRRLPAAVAAGELVVHFQPFVSVAGGRVEGAEALVRWQHPEHGLLGPDAFVPAAERTGLIRPVTLHVLDVALAHCARWRAAGPATFGVSVNVSAHDLDDPRLVGDVRAALHRHALPPGALGLEVTETMAMRDAAQAGRTLRALADLGVRLAVDDYGVGYGSLDYLRRLPFTVLKVDRAFVAPAADDRVCAEILRSTVDLGHALGMYVVAEGVEDDRTLALLRGLGCDAAQGWALGRPGPAAALDGRLGMAAPVN
ncbi:bifunctional diguanylate cyclase/phosphodiesterase [Cellulomonas sp. ACRRI]|uniref:putative bifunctional diguanylate cyclase/phosphodiesterase n=1 Tax=Cellulomonas sp. ACRRI TaxID=2918188 RepID=UPI001EF2799A|nr:bifunctional diguanylate cyclase/phosphodiesterase [Cellulomonas sp. ACRRI]MCG7287334.1 bifunctional diguanylate cyclase/phosphodiesterase [Cellulomonas sp. ACRRI]